jgi:hypothetical protein
MHLSWLDLLYTHVHVCISQACTYTHSHSCPHTHTHTHTLRRTWKSYPTAYTNTLYYTTSTTYQQCTHALVTTHPIKPSWISLKPLPPVLCTLSAQYILTIITMYTVRLLTHNTPPHPLPLPLSLSLYQLLTSSDKHLHTCHTWVLYTHTHNIYTNVQCNTGWTRDASPTLPLVRSNSKHTSNHCFLTDTQRK